MSWWVYLKSDQAPVAVDKHAEGGTYVLGGTDEAELNITYNYGTAFRDAWPEPIREPGALDQMLHGRAARDTIEPLEQAVGTLGTERSDDYWEATPGNAGYALSILLGWARQHPDAVWDVS